MRPRSLPRGTRFAIPLLLALTLGSAVSAQTLVPGSPAIPPESRTRLSSAADDARLAPWQRDLMLRLAAPGSDDAAASPDRAERALDATNGTWGEMILDSRWSHRAVYDPVRDCLVVFGGVDSTNRYLDDIWVLSLAGATPGWVRLAFTGTPPMARHSASMIYDSRRDRVVVFGGRAGSSPYFLGDVWALSLANAATWTQLAPTGTPPSARYGHSAIYDPVGDRMVVFGGSDAGVGYRNDLWALSLDGAGAWTQLAPTGTPPAARTDHSAICDPARRRMLVYGGLTSGGKMGDVWAMSLGTPAWSALAPGGMAPSNRYAHSAAYDAARDRMLVYAGDGFGTPSGNVWALSLAGTPTWSAIVPGSPSPSARSYQAAIYDPVRDRLVAFGGCTEAGGARNDLWALALGATPAWTELTPNGAPPGGRNFSSAIVDPMRWRLIVFGGAAPGRLNDVWALSLEGVPVWSAPSITGGPPTARYGHSAVYDQVRDRMVVFGGWVQGPTNNFANDVWALTLTPPMTWTQLTPSGTPPTPRAWHSAIYDYVRDRMLVFGGNGYDGVFTSSYNDVWALSFAGTPAWTQLAPAGGPPQARTQHSAVYDAPRDRMVVFGGDAGTRLNDVWALSLAGTPTWTALAPTGTKPSARAVHAAIYDPLRQRMVVCGGIPGGATADVWALSLDGAPAWSQLAPAELAPPSLSAFPAVYDTPRDRMVAFAGQPFRNTVWALQWTTPVAVGGAPARPPVALLRPAPNPARGPATVRYAIPRAGRVRVDVHDAGGRLVRALVDGERPAGAGSTTWDGADAAGLKAAPGVYLVRLVAPGVRMTRRIVRVE